MPFDNSADIYDVHKQEPTGRRNTDNPLQGGGWGSRGSREAGARGRQINNRRRHLGALAYEGG